MCSIELSFSSELYNRPFSVFIFGNHLSSFCTLPFESTFSSIQISHISRLYVSYLHFVITPLNLWLFQGFFSEQKTFLSVPTIFMEWQVRIFFSFPTLWVVVHSRISCHRITPRIYFDICKTIFLKSVMCI